MKLEYNNEASPESQLLAFVNLGKYARGELQQPQHTFPITRDLAIGHVVSARDSGDLALWAAMFAQSLTSYQGLLDDLGTGKVKEPDIDRSMLREALEGLAICL